MKNEVRKLKILKTGDEDSLRLFIETVAEGQGWHVSHIESPITSPGIPDLNLHKNNTDLWIELKVRKSNGFTMRPPQRRWHRNRARAGGRSWVLAYSEGYLYAIPGAEAAHLLPRSLAWTAGPKYGLEDVASLLGLLGVL